MTESPTVEDHSPKSVVLDPITPLDLFIILKNVPEPFLRSPDSEFLVYNLDEDILKIKNNNTQVILMHTLVRKHTVKDNTY